MLILSHKLTMLCLFVCHGRNSAFFKRIVQTTQPIGANNGKPDGPPTPMMVLGQDFSQINLEMGLSNPNQWGRAQIFSAEVRSVYITIMVPWGQATWWIWWMFDPVPPVILGEKPWETRGKSVRQVEKCLRKDRCWRSGWKPGKIPRVFPPWNAPFNDVKASNPIQNLQRWREFYC